MYAIRSYYGIIEGKSVDQMVRDIMRVSNQAHKRDVRTIVRTAFNLAGSEARRAVNAANSDVFVITSYSIHYTKLYELVLAKDAYKELAQYVAPKRKAIEHSGAVETNKEPLVIIVDQPS